MKDHYFYQDQGKTQGPIDIDEIRERIKDGRLKLFDLIYRDGEENWRMALEHPALRSEFSTTSLASMKERPWVCLQRKDPGTLEFITTGPFTKEEVDASLQSGVIGYSDYAWRDGFLDWKRIGALEEFNPRLRANAMPAPEYESPAREIVENVVEFRRPTLAPPEPPPPEARTSDLTEAPPPVPKKSKGSKSLPRIGSPPPPPPVPTPKAEATADPVKTDSTKPEKEKVQKPFVERRKRRRGRTAVDWGLVGVLALVLAAMVLIFSRFILPHSATPVLATTPPSLETAPPEPPGTPASAEVGNETLPPPPDASENESEAEAAHAIPDGDTTDEPPEAPAKVAGKPPHELFLAVQNVSANQARIEIRTDGSSDFPVYVQVVGLPGQVSEGGAFYRFMRFTPSGSADKPLDLSALKLPQGRFILRAETGTLKREAKLNMGISEASFKQAVTHQRKAWAHAIWKERLQLFKLSQQLEKQLTMGMVPTKKFSSKGLEALVAVKRVNGAKFYMFEDWWELHQITKEARAGVTQALLGRAQKERDRLSTFSVWK